jgi:hypothetical protein
MVRDCAPENLVIPGLVLPGMTEQDNSNPTKIGQNK